MPETTYLTPAEVAERVYTTMRDHQARTAIDLTQVASLRIVISSAAFTEWLIRHDGKGQDRLDFQYGKNEPGAPVHMLLRGIRVVGDPHLHPHEVRLRTELVA